MAGFTIASTTLRSDTPSRRMVVSSQPSSAPPNQRLVSLDALRGMTMFWIMGGRELVLATVACLYPAGYDAWETQLTHTRWEGFVAWDMIMPIFLFLVGASMPFALGKRIEQGESLRATYGRIARRVAILWILGMLAQGSLLKFHWRELELFSNSLQAIAVGYLITSVALLHLRLRGQIVLLVALVLGYWCMLTFIPFAGHPAGTLGQYVNFPRYVDEQVLRGFRRDHSFTWIVTSSGFAATVLLGAMAGKLLRGRLSVQRKLLYLIAIGATCTLAGWIWSYWVPLNRHLWTSSMILWAGGWSFVLIAGSYALIDVAGVKKWAFPFVVIGANALFAYVFDHVFDRTLSDTLLVNLSNQWSAPYGELLRSIGEVGLLWLILWYLYSKRTFLRA